MICIFFFIRDDKEVVLIAVKQNGRVLSYASEKLQADRDVVVAAVSKLC